jgi:hypothetical protein
LETSSAFLEKALEHIVKPAAAAAAAAIKLSEHVEEGKKQVLHWVLKVATALKCESAVGSSAKHIIFFNSRSRML